MSASNPTIWEALAVKLGREPTNEEAAADVKRILREGAEERMQRDPQAYLRRSRRITA